MYIIQKGEKNRCLDFPYSSKKKHTHTSGQMDHAKLPLKLCVHAYNHAPECVSTYAQED